MLRSDEGNTGKGIQKARIAVHRPDRSVEI